VPDLKLLEKLCLAPGISGREDRVRSLILEEIKPYADQWQVDGLGNLIVWKKGKQRPKVKLMLSAHMDEVGFLVTRVAKDGTLSLTCVGGIDQRVIPGRCVTVGDQRIPGVIGAKPIHLLKGEEKEKAVPMDDLRIDIGAKDQEEALRWVQPGDDVCFESSFEVAGEAIQAKALDDRAGCMVLISMIRSELPYDMYFTFVVQEEVGLRGAAAAAYSVNPEAALVIESTTAADIHGVDEDKRVCAVGRGAVLSFMDKRTIYDREYFQLAFHIAKEQNIPCQAKQAVAGGNDAGAIHVSRGGVRTLALSLPCRYLHSAVSLISKSDLEAVESLTALLAERIASGSPVG
jgi:putative aminopeptidase FrvX